MVGLPKNNLSIEPSLSTKRVKEEIAYTDDLSEKTPKKPSPKATMTNAKANQKITAQKRTDRIMLPTLRGVVSFLVLLLAGATVGRSVRASCCSRLPHWIAGMSVRAS